MMMPEPNISAITTTSGRWNAATISSSAEEAMVSTVAKVRWRVVRSAAHPPTSTPEVAPTI